MLSAVRESQAVTCAGIARRRRQVAPSLKQYASVLGDSLTTRHTLSLGRGLAADIVRLVWRLAVKPRPYSLHPESQPDTLKPKLKCCLETNRRKPRLAPEPVPGLLALDPDP